MQKIRPADLQAEYEYVVNQGVALIKKVAPVSLSSQSIEDIHYWYRKAADLRIQMGDPRHKIVGKVYEDFEQFYGERHIRRILKEGGIDLPEENGQLSENNSSLNRYEISNGPYFEIFDLLEGLCKAVKNVLRTEYFLDQEERCKEQLELVMEEHTRDHPDVKQALQNLKDAPEKQRKFDAELKEFYPFAKAMIKNANDAFDRRREYKVNTLHVLLQKAILYGVNEADYHYSCWVRPFIESVAKQTRKVIMGWVPELPMIMRLKTVDEAVYYEFSGYPCRARICNGCKHPNKRSAGRCEKCGNATFHVCGSLHVKTEDSVSNDNMPATFLQHCFKCGHKSDPEPGMLYKNPNSREIDLMPSILEFSKWKKDNQIAIDEEAVIHR